MRPGRGGMRPLSLSPPKKNAPVRLIKSVRNGGAVCLVCLACFFSSPRPSRQAVCALSSGASRRPALSPLPFRSPHSARVCVSAPGRARARGGHPGTHALSLSPGTRTHTHTLVSVCARSRRAPVQARHLCVPVPRRPRAALARTPLPTPHSRRGDLLPPPFSTSPVNESGTGRRPVSGGQSSSSIALFYTGRETPGHALGWWWVLGERWWGRLGVSHRRPSAPGPASS